MAGLTDDAMLDDEDFLAALYRNLPDEPIEPSDPRFVDPREHPEAFGPDIVRELSRAIRFSGEGSVFFLSGTRGSGKSTQLLRLREDLYQHGYLALRVDAEEYLNVRRPLHLVEMLFALVGGISEALCDERWLPERSIGERAWDTFRNQADGLRVATDGELKAGIPGLAEVKVKLVRDATFVDRLNAWLQGTVSELAEAADTVVGDLVATLRPLWERTGTEWKGLVVLFDSLDHVRGVDFHDVRRQLQLILGTYSETLRLPSVRTLYVVPPWVTPGLSHRRLMANVKVRTRDGGRFDPGVDTLVETVRRRVPGGQLDRLFPDPPALRDLVADSGGHLRDVLRLVRAAAEATAGPPFTQTDLARARTITVEGMVPIADDGRRALRHVRDSGTVYLPHEDGWEALAELFDRHLILGYRNGELWYDVHPLALPIIEEPDAPHDR